MLRTFLTFIWCVWMGGSFITGGIFAQDDLSSEVRLHLQNDQSSGRESELLVTFENVGAQPIFVSAPEIDGIMGNPRLLLYDCDGRQLRPSVIPGKYPIPSSADIHNKLSKFLLLPSQRTVMYSLELNGADWYTLPTRTNICKAVAEFRSIYSGEIIMSEDSTTIWEGVVQSDTLYFHDLIIE